MWLTVCREAPKEQCSATEIKGLAGSHASVTQNRKDFKNTWHNYCPSVQSDSEMDVCVGEQRCLCSDSETSVYACIFVFSSFLRSDFFFVCDEAILNMPLKLLTWLRFVSSAACWKAQQRSVISGRKRLVVMRLKQVSWRHWLFLIYQQWRQIVSVKKKIIYWQLFHRKEERLKFLLDRRQSDFRVGILLN